MAEMELRRSVVMRSRVVKTFIAAAMLSCLAWCASEASAAPTRSSTRSYDWTPMVNYGEPETGGEIHGFSRWIYALRLGRLRIGEIFTRPSKVLNNSSEREPLRRPSVRGGN